MNSFRCKRCGACCKQPGFVYLTQADVDRLASFFRIDPYQFTEQSCVLLDRKHLAMKKHPDETCLFLRPDGCSVYAARPAQCREFPLSWKTERTLQYCEGMKKGKG
ncbi:MAG TPA: YkgJ family cysteine cluster protein [Candidatus Omnitrophota bacterium]|nr:YkgJ family cysteine cluster protein [Candidatus Omnitrophota bacterium]HPS36356.1 YkgJ family cysteine cluster protein [Candidatus Omnitrophota bacterium]